MNPLVDATNQMLSHFPGWFPRLCLGCQGAETSHLFLRAFCNDCGEELGQASSRAGLYSAFSYSEPVMAAISRWKRSSTGTAIDQPLLELACARLVPILEPVPDNAVVVPLPPAPFRTLRRGFHPPDRLAAALARQLGINAVWRALFRTDFGQQRGAKRAERLQHPPTIVLNPILARTLRQPGPTLVLVDDVVGTGASLRAAEQALSILKPAKTIKIVLARS